MDRPLVLITGATSGIGLASANHFAKNGYDLILTGRRSERLQTIKSNLEIKYGCTITYLTFDIRSYDEVESSLNSVEQLLPDLNILINNAGLAKGYNPVNKGSIDHWETMIDTNIKGLLYMTKLISPYFIENKKGHIINTCSTAGHEVYPNGNVYCATKHAVDALTKSMRLDFYKHNIRVSQVSPGHVEQTEFALNRFDGNKEKAKIYEDFVPLNSDDVAEIIYFIATRKAHVNIQDILVMGTQQAGSNFINRNGRS